MMKLDTVVNHNYNDGSPLYRDNNKYYNNYNRYI